MKIRAGLLIGLAGLVGPVALASPSALSADDPDIQYAKTSWTEKDGLPSPTVWSLAQDRDGYLWIGTARGLVRFDGVRFVPFDSSTLPSANVGVTALCATSDGSIWRAFWGTPRVDRINGEQTETFGPNDGLPNGEIRTLLADREGAVWAGGHGGISRFRNQRWERAELPSGLTVWSLYEDRQGRVWADTSGGIFRLNKGEDAFTNTKVLSRIALGFAETPDGTIAVMDPIRGLTALAGPGPVQQWVFPELGDVSRLFSDHLGTLWVGTQGRGLRRRSTRGSGSGEHYTIDDGLAGNVVLSLLEDREGDIWVGTADGLTRFSDGTFKALPVFDRTSGLVRAIAADKAGTVWIGTRRGLIQLAGGTRRTFGYAEGLPRVVINSIHADNGGSVWIGTAGGLVRYTNGEIVPVPFAAELKLISAITTDRAGGVWICDRDKGIFRWHDDMLQSFRDVTALDDQPVSAVFADRSNRVWIGFSTGTVSLYENGQFRHYGQDSGLPGGPITAIFEDDLGIWVGATNGLSRFGNGRFVTLFVRDGLPADRLSAVIEDDDGYLWIGGNERVLRLNRMDFERAALEHAQIPVRLFDTSDGLRGDPMFGQGYPNVARSSTGTLWWVTTAGVYQADPRRVSAFQGSPIVKIEDVIVNGERTAPAAQLRLPRHVSTLQFNYTALSLRAPSKIRFHFKMDGLDRDWVDNGTSRRVSYVNVPPGRYQFHVIGSGENGVWNSSGPAVYFLVPARFYETVWFYSLSFLAVGIVLVTLWRWRLAQVRRRYALVFAERARLGRELHDTLLQSLVGLGLHVDNIADQLALCSAPQSITRELRRIRKQVEHYSTEARQSIWDLRNPELNSEEFVEAIRRDGESITARTEVRLEVVADGSPLRYPADVQMQLRRIAREAVTNAVLHANPSRISVRVSYAVESMTLRVCDDGRGFAPQGSDHDGAPHWGLAIMRERAQQVGGQLNIVSAPGQGTIVETTAPFARHSSADLLQ